MIVPCTRPVYLFHPEPLRSPSQLNETTATFSPPDADSSTVPVSSCNNEPLVPHKSAVNETPLHTTGRTRAPQQKPQSSEELLTRQETSGLHSQVAIHRGKNFSPAPPQSRLAQRRPASRRHCRRRSAVHRPAYPPATTTGRPTPSPLVLSSRRPGLLHIPTTTNTHN